MKVPLLSLVGALSLTAVATAQQLPDWGVLAQPLQLERNLKLPGQTRALAPLPDVQLRTPAGAAAVHVNRFEIEGNTVVPTVDLLASVAPFLNRSLDLAGLQEATQSIVATYKTAGRLAHAYLPQQDVTNGVVKIAVVEARLGRIVAESPDNPLVSIDRVTSMLDAIQKSGDILDVTALDRALLLADDLAGVVVEGRLRAGQNEGETDVVLALSRELRVTGDVGIDNTGSRSTGELREYANLTLNSPSGQGDALQLGAVHSDGSDYVNARYQVNVGSHGWRMGVSGSDLRYRLVSSDFSALGANGYSTALGLDASYPLVRSQSANLYGKVQFDQRSYHNESLGITQSHYDTESATSRWPAMPLMPGAVEA